MEARQAFSPRNSRILPRSDKGTAGTTRAFSRSVVGPTADVFLRFFSLTRMWDGWSTLYRWPRIVRTFSSHALLIHVGLRMTWWIIATAASRDWRENFYYFDKAPSWKISIKWKKSKCLRCANFKFGYNHSIWLVFGR